MIIDCHTHITYGKYPEFSTKLGRHAFNVRTLLKRMDEEGIDQSVLLPLANPENVDMLAVAGNLECVEAAKKYPDRLMTFCDIDPRNLLNTPKADLSRLLRVYQDLGCRGIGEMCAGLPITDPRYQNLFHHAGACKMPVLFHLTGKSRGVYGIVDKIHLPGLEASLKQFPDTIFIGHAMAFWAEIDGALKPSEREIYPSSPIKKQGRLWHLLDKYPNLYGDVSAGSGYNAISRDPETCYRFLQKFNRKLFFGTDRFTRPDEPAPKQIAYLKAAVEAGKITRDAYENIMWRNYKRVVLGQKG